MKTLSLARACGGVVAGAVLVGCSGASWKRVEIDSEYRVPKVVTVAVVASPSARDVAQVLASAVVDELTGDGIQATVVPEASGAADANLTIAKWDPGSRGLRWLAWFAGGKGEITVEVEGASVGVEGTAHGWVIGGWLGGDSENSVTAAGHLIGQTIATGRSEPPRSRIPPR